MTNQSSATRKRSFVLILSALVILIVSASLFFLSRHSDRHTSPSSPKKIFGHHITIISQAHHTGKIKIDNSDFVPIELNTGDEKKYDASTKIELIIDTPKDINLAYNGKPVNFSRAQKTLHLLFP